MKTLIALSLIFISLNIYAEIDNPSDQIFVKTLPEIEKLGGWSSGGGNAVVCFQFINDHSDPPYYFKFINSDGSLKNEAFTSGSIVSIETFDLYEARLPRGIDQSEIPEIIAINPDENITPYISKLSNRYKDFVSPVSNIVTSGKKFIPDTNVRFYNGAVTQNKDYNPAIILNDQNCIVTTIANQHSNNGFYELFIDARAFNHIAHSKLSKAALILHEYVYAVARSLGQEDSHSTRKVVELLITKNQDYTARYIASLIKNLDFTHQENDLFLVDLSKDSVSLVAQSISDMASFFRKDGLIDPDFQEYIARFRKFLINWGFSPFPRNQFYSIVNIYSWYINMDFQSEIESDLNFQNLVAELKNYHDQSLNRLSSFTESIIQHNLPIIENMYGNTQDKITLIDKMEFFLNKQLDNANIHNYSDSGVCGYHFCSNLEIIAYNGRLKELFISESDLDNLLILDHTPRD